MKSMKTLDRILIIVGTVLVLLSVIAPFIFGFFSLVSDGIFRFDYLMPAELFLVVLVGGFLLLLCTIRMKEHRGLIGGTLGAAIVMLFASQGIAIVTGLADGSIGMDGWQYYLVLGGIILYDLLAAGLGVEGVWIATQYRREASGYTPSP